MSLIHWLEEHQVPCYNKKLFGIECPGCGMQSAIIQLLKGDVAGSIETYPPLIPIMFLIVYLVLHIIFNFRKGAFVLKISFIFTVLLMVINYIYKMIFIYQH